MLSPEGQVPGSFRDPAGAVYDQKGRILRVCYAEGLERISPSEVTGFLEQLVAARRLVAFTPVTAVEGIAIPNGGVILEHPRLPFISYPYEWSFDYLKRAALFHLQLQIDAFDAGVVLVDATPFNIQFVNGHPVFIDHLSFKRYAPGELWWGYDQFLRGFVNPLVLAAAGRGQWRTLYRGMLAMIDSETARSLLPLRQRLKRDVFWNVSVPALLQRTGKATQGEAKSLALPPEKYRAQLVGLLRLLEKLELRSDASHWESYTETRTYDREETEAKRAFVGRYCANAKPKLLFDLGCNTGEFAQIALENGVTTVVGIDTDVGSIERCAKLSNEKGLNFIPLVGDVLDPTPAMGWRNKERYSMLARCQGQSVIALAVAHHLSITGQVPLAQVVKWLTDTFCDGVVEFVPLNDPMAVALIQNARAKPVGYSLDQFETSLAAGADIVDRAAISATGRTLFQFRSNR